MYVVSCISGCDIFRISENQIHATHLIVQKELQPSFCGGEGSGVHSEQQISFVKTLIIWKGGLPDMKFKKIHSASVPSKRHLPHKYVVIHSKGHTMFRGIYCEGAGFFKAEVSVWFCGHD